jgi:hypothetical protein
LWPFFYLSFTFSISLFEYSFFASHFLLALPLINFFFLSL